MGKKKAKTRPEIPKKPDLSPAMQALLEEAYTLFKCELHFPLTLCTCPVCLSEENLRALQTTPVRELSEALIYEYLNAVVSKSDDDYQIRHFLPRILEMIAHYIEIRVDDSLNLDRCHFESDSWKPQELNFMRRFSHQFILDTINFRPNQADGVAVYLVMFDLAGLETSHLLDRSLWLEEADPIKALLALEEIYYYYTKDYAHFDYIFSDNPAYNQQMTDWLNSRELAQGFFPILENVLLSEEEMASTENYRLEQLYQIFESRIEV